MNSLTSPPKDIFTKTAYDVRTLDDEIRIDGYCEALLKECYQLLVDAYELSPEAASKLCYGAGYFLREYLIPEQQSNLFDVDPQQIRQFAGNWYIIKNIEPNLSELTTILEGVTAFYQYCLDRELIAPALLETVRAACADLAYYQERIASFWAIEKDGYQQWNAVCPLTKAKIS